MKKLLSIFLCLCLIFSFAGCAREKKNIAIAEHISNIEQTKKIATGCIEIFQKGVALIEKVSPPPMKPVTDNPEKDHTLTPSGDDTATEDTSNENAVSSILNFYVPMESSNFVDRQGFHIKLEPIDDTHGTFHLGTDYWVFISREEFEEYKKEYKLKFTYEEYAKRRAIYQPNYVAVLVDPETGKLSFDYTKQVEYTSTFSYTWNKSTGLMLTTWAGAETIELLGDTDNDRIIDGTYATYTISNYELYPKKFDYH